MIRLLLASLLVLGSKYLDLREETGACELHAWAYGIPYDQCPASDPDCEVAVVQR